LSIARALCQRLLTGLCLLSGLTLLASAAEAQPSIQRLQPLGVTPGGTTEVQVHGGGIIDGTRLWTSCHLEAQPAPEKPAGHFLVTAPPDTPLGIHGVRVVSEAGVSRLGLFLVDDLPAVAAAADNREFVSAQDVTLPTAIDGAVEKLHRHYFRFEAAAGQQISLEVLARRLGSPLDPAIFLYRQDGRELAYSDDVEGLSGDCQLVHTFDEAGTYVLEVRDIRYEGSGGHFYRLRIGDFPCLNVSFPLAVQRGQSTRIDFAGLSVADADPAHVDIPADWPHDWYPVSTRRSGGTATGFARVAVTDSVEYREQEPNDTPAQANRITLGDNINGRFDVAGDKDRYTFTATSGQRFFFRGITRQRGSATDLVLRLVDAEGKQLARKDDDDLEEGTIDHTFAADGEYTLIAEDLHGRGGQPYAYRVEVEPYTKGFSITAAADQINIPAGGVGTLAVNVARRDDNGTITVEARGLPEGWTSLPTIIGPSINAGIITIRGPDVAPVPAQVAELTIVGMTDIGGTPQEHTADLTATLVAQLGNVRSIPLNIRTSVAAAVTPAAPYSLRFEPAEVVFGPHLTTSVKLIANRSEAISEQITLATLPEKDALPRETTLALKPIEKGQNEVVLELAGGEKAPPGPFSFVLTATHKQGNTTHVVHSPPLQFRIEPAMKLQVDAGDRNLPREGEQKITVTLTRNPAFTGDVTLSLDKLPAGVTADPVTLPADQNRIDITLKATAEAAAADVADITVKATAAGNDKLTSTQPLGKLTIQ
jgi:hypothetical protein